jgi:hypothetical protein
MATMSNSKLIKNKFAIVVVFLLICSGCSSTYRTDAGLENLQKQWAAEDEARKKNINELHEKLRKIDEQEKAEFQALREKEEARRAKENFTPPLLAEIYSIARKWDESENLTIAEKDKLTKLESFVGKEIIFQGEISSVDRDGGFNMSLPPWNNHIIAETVKPCYFLCFADGVFKDKEIVLNLRKSSRIFVKGVIANIGMKNTQLEKPIPSHVVSLSIKVNNAEIMENDSSR